jgi:hypothetical protein
MCAKLSLAEFQDDMDVVNILDNFLKSSGLDTSSREGAQAYKLDQPLEWIEWAETVDLTMSTLTGPEARTTFEYASEDSLGIPGRMATWHQRFMHATWSTTGAIYLGQRMSSCS